MLKPEYLTSTISTTVRLVEPIKARKAQWFESVLDSKHWRAPCLCGEARLLHIAALCAQHALECGIDIPANQSYSRIDDWMSNEEY
jgi:hypothetical protein